MPLECLEEHEIEIAFCKKFSDLKIQGIFSNGTQVCKIKKGLRERCDLAAACDESSCACPWRELRRDQITHVAVRRVLRGFGGPAGCLLA